ncbi:MAG: asparagine synthase-related protein [Vulcanimicrobiota bacterium]
MAVVDPVARDCQGRLEAMLQRLLGLGFGPHGTFRWCAPGVALGYLKFHQTGPEAANASPVADEKAALVAEARLDCPVSVGGQSPNPSQTMLAAYHHWQETFPNKLYGDFAFALWDQRTQALLCGRDHIGSRPLYYSRVGTAFLLASDVRALLATEASTQLDETYLLTSLSRKAFVDPQRTFYEHIFKVPPAHTLKWTAAGLSLTRYWRPDDLPELQLAEDDDYLVATRELLERVVEDRIQGYPAVAVHASGGLDSSAVAALTARSRRRQGLAPPLAFTWLTEKCRGEQEFQTLLEFCESEGMQLETTCHDPSTLADFFRRNPACQPTLRALVSELAIQQKAQRRGLPVILSGWGGDEGFSFNGRGMLASLLKRGQWRECYRQACARGKPWKQIARWGILPLLFHRLLPWAPRSWRHHLSDLLAFGASRKPSPFLREELSRRGERYPTRWVLPYGVHETQLQLLRQGGTTARLEQWYASGREHGVAYAYPLLDRRALEFCLALPPRLFCRDGVTRWLMRVGAAELLPASIRFNSKAEPVRAQQGVEDVREALALLARQWRSEGIERHPFRYINVAKLLSAMETSEVGIGKLMHASSIIALELAQDGVGLAD